MQTADASSRPRLAAARARPPTVRGRVLALLVTVAIFVLIFQRIPLEQLITALGDADFVPFLALMIPSQMLAFLPVIFMLAALPITIAHLGTTQAAWIFFFGSYAPAPRLLAFSLAAHLTFMSTRALLGLVLLPRAYHDLMEAPRYRYSLP